MSNGNLKRLKDLTENLTAYPGFPYYEFSYGGTIRVWGLMNRDAVGVIDTYMPKGSYFPGHGNLVNQWILVYLGEIELTSDNTTTLCKPGDSIYFAPNIEHTMRALVDSGFISVTIPCEEGMPYVPDRRQHIPPTG